MRLIVDGSGTGAVAEKDPDENVYVRKSESHEKNTVSFPFEGVCKLKLMKFGS